jgi:Spy/CpxP family protein refolding chaperone
MSLFRGTVMTRIHILVGVVILFACASTIGQGQVTTRQMGTRRTTGNGDPSAGSYSIPATKDPDAADPEQQKIWEAARQLNLDSDQDAQLESSLKAQKEDGANFEKELQEARAALARALQNGQSSLESEIEDLASAIAKVQESQLKRWALLYTVLTPDQQKRMLMMSTPLSQAATLSAVVPAE